MVVAEVSIEPIGTGNASFSDIVAAGVTVLEHQKDIKYEITALGTLLQGEQSQILQLVQQMEEACFKAGAQRCITNVRIDDRRDRPMLNLQQMQSEVEKKMGQGRQSRMRM